MNFLAVAQLALNAIQVIGKQSRFDHDDVHAVKSGLEQLANLCQQEHETQLKAAQEQKDKKEEPKDASH